MILIIMKIDLMVTDPAEEINLTGKNQDKGMILVDTVQEAKEDLDPEKVNITEAVAGTVTIEVQAEKDGMRAEVLDQDPDQFSEME